MENTQSYTFTEQEFKQIEKLADYIYNTSVVLKKFCGNSPYTEDLQNILPIVGFLHNNSDILNNIFINHGNKKYQ